MKTFEKMAAQGDLMITKIDALPTGVVPIEPEGANFVLAHSETGHNHVMERTNVKALGVTDDEKLFKMFIEVTAPTPIEHLRSFDTHEPIMVPPGIYRINRQREYTPEGYRRAAD